jgi:hypothetical protein
MSDLDNLYIGIRQALLSSAPLTALVGERIYKKVQPETDHSLPYVAFYLSSGGYENIVAGDLLNVTVTVEAWALTDKLAGDVFDAARAALHSGTFAVSGWSHFWCRAENIYDFPPELFGGTWYFRTGADFRIRVEKG